MSPQAPDRKHRITLDANPEPITVDTSTTAVVVIDMQNDFGVKGGLFDHAGLDISMIQRAVAPTAGVLAAARNAGVKVIYLNMGFLPDLSDLGAPDSPNRMRHLMFGVGQTVRAPDGTESRFLIRDTWNTAVVSELTPERGETVIYKHRFSGFYETEFDELLKNFGMKSLPDPPITYR